jgi:hypothetical protein
MPPQIQSTGGSKPFDPPAVVDLIAQLSNI